jgi:hypothetical protein
MPKSICFACDKPALVGGWCKDHVASSPIGAAFRRTPRPVAAELAPLGAFARAFADRARTVRQAVKARIAERDTDRALTSGEVRP